MTRTALAAIGALSALVVASVLVPVQGHASPEQSERIQVQRPWRKILSVVDYNRDDVRDALRELIGNVGMSYTIDPAVQGTVTMSLHNVSFESALTTLLGQVNADYRIEGGIIHIFPRTAAAFVPPTAGTTGPQILLDSAPAPSGDTVVVQDATFLYVLRGARMFKVRKSDLRVIAAGTVPK